MSILIALFFWLMLFICFYLNKKYLDKRFVFLLFIRSVSASAFVYVYTHYYKGDLSYYFSLSTRWVDDSLWEVLCNKIELTQLELHQPRMLFFAKVFHFVRIFSFSNLYLMALFFSGLGSLFLLEAYKIIARYDKGLLLSFVLALCFPSLVFWTSGVSKEALVFPATLFVVLYVWSNLKAGVFKLDFQGVFMFLVAVFLILQLRYFYFPFLLFLLFVYLMFSQYKNYKFWVFVSAILVFYVSFQAVFLPQLQYSILLHLVYENYHEMLRLSRSGLCVSVDYLDRDFSSMLWAFVQAYKGVFFVSFKNLFVLMVSVENILVFVLCLFSLWKAKNLNKEQLSLFVFVFLCAGFFTLVSPNYGSLSRYRVFYWFWMIWFGLESLKKKPSD